MFYCSTGSVNTIPEQAPPWVVMRDILYGPGGRPKSWTHTTTKVFKIMCKLHKLPGSGHLGAVSDVKPLAIFLRRGIVAEEEGLERCSVGLLVKIEQGALVARCTLGVPATASVGLGACDDSGPE